MISITMRPTQLELYLGVFIKLGQHMASLYVPNHCLDEHK